MPCGMHHKATPDSLIDISWREVISLTVKIVLNICGGMSDLDRYTTPAFPGNCIT